MKKYILIAGVNGAGKSTLYHSLDEVKRIPRVNTDEIVRSIGDWKNPLDVYIAGKMAVKMIDEHFRTGCSFNQETTLCGKSITRNIMRARTLGYETELYYVGVASAEIAKERIAYRVAHGGHGIPDADVERRYSESLKRLRELISVFDMVALYDNSQSFQQFATYKRGLLHSLVEPVPDWYRSMILDEN